MRWVLALGFAVGVLGSTARANAAEPVLRPWEISGRVGYAVGNLSSLSAVPLGVDLGYRLSPRWSLGVYGGLDFAQHADDAEDADEVIKAKRYRVGVEAVFHFPIERRIEPWIGLGMGFEALRGATELSSTWPTPYFSSRPYRADGLELLNLQLGFDVLVSSVFVLGPYLSGSVVTYRNQQGVPASEDFYFWGTIGVKGTLRL